MKKSITFLVYPLTVIAMSLFIIVGCNDEEDDATPDNDNDYGYVTDIDGNEYKTVVIGNQEWMTKNLRVTRYNTGEEIPTGLGNMEWSETNLTEYGAYAIYDHTEDFTDGLNSPEQMVNAYGKLYNWYAVDDDRGLCPEGWSVPSDDDWTQLVDYVADQGFPNDNVVNGDANALKSCRQVDSPLEGCNTSEHPRWHEHETHHGFDEFGFSALPSGGRDVNGSFGYLGEYGSWWSSSERSSAHAWGRGMVHDYGGLGRSSGNKSSGFGLRCVRNL